MGTIISTITTILPFPTNQRVGKSPETAFGPLLLPVGAEAFAHGAAEA